MRTAYFAAAWFSMSTFVQYREGFKDDNALVCAALMFVFGFLYIADYQDWKKK